MYVAQSKRKQKKKIVNSTFKIYKVNFGRPTEIKKIIKIISVSKDYADISRGGGVRFSRFAACMVFFFPKSENSSLL